MKSIDTSAEGGFFESEHTADMAMEVWAPSLTGLFINAAKGMFSLIGIQLKKGGPPTHHHIRTRAEDNESLLVKYLSELLYLSERYAIGFTDYHVSLAGGWLYADVTAAAASSPEKTIKAVTYHDLAIFNDADGYHVKVVFDV